MANRASSFRNTMMAKENSTVGVKEVTKLVNGPTLRRAVLGDIGNKAARLQRSASEATKHKKPLDTFKKPAATKTRFAKKTSKLDESVISNNSTTECGASVCESSMQSVPATPATVASVEDSSIMSLVEEMHTEVQVAIVEDEEVQDLSAAFSSKLLTVTDIDAEDKDNPQLVSEYANEIYIYMRMLENKHLVRRRYLDTHSITSRMRTILVDWLVQVHIRFNLMQETLYLTIAMLDRYLQVAPETPKEELQLVGVTAMFVACKYEEMYCSEIGDFVFITDKAYTKQQIRRMEINILKKLNFHISYPLPLHFLRRNSKAAQVDGTQHTLAKYLMELCLPDYNMCHFKASEIAAAALYLTMRLIGDEPEWTDTLVYYSGYSEAELTPTLCKMAQCITRSHSSKQQAIPQKYRSAKHLKISELPQLRGSLIRSLSERAASVGQ